MPNVCILSFVYSFTNLLLLLRAVATLCRRVFMYSLTHSLIASSEGGSDPIPESPMQVAAEIDADQRLQLEHMLRYIVFTGYIYYYSWPG